MTQTEKAREDLQMDLPNNPFVPPKGDVCFINNLPPELLSRIFEVGTADDGSGEDDEDVEADFWDDLRSRLGEKETDEEEDSDDGMREESEEESEGDEETDEGDSDSSDSSDVPWPPFPIVVSHVCRHWRNVALSTLSLWTTIVVAQGAHPPYEAVLTMLERSKGLLIDIYVDCEAHEDACNVEPPSDADLKFLFSLLIPHIHRWRTMEVSVSEYHHMYVFLSAVSDSSISAAPQLRTLELYHHEETEEFDSFGYPSMSKHLTLFGGSAPLLTKVVLWGVHIDWDQPWISSASNLTDLELAFHPEDVRPSWAQFASSLRGAPALEKLSLRQSGPSGDPPQWFIEPTAGGPAGLNGPIQLLRVTDFVFAFHTQTCAIGVLRKLCLPALKSLVLDFDNGDYTEFVHELAGPATSVSPAREQPRSLLSRLDSLKIAGLPCRSECIQALYGELQNLTSLNISLSYLAPQFLDILGTPCTLPGHGDIWLPRLVTLYVSGTFGDTLREMVGKRKDAGVPLSSLYVEESCEVNREDVVWLRKNLNTLEFFAGSDDEDVIDFEDEEVDMWSDVD